MPGPTRSLARLAGALYLVLITCGIGSEAAVRAALFVPGDASTTAANVVAHEGAFRLSILADVGMALADVGLGVALLVLLWRAGAGLALTATAFRLAQAAILGLNLAFLMAAIPLAHGVAGLDDSAGLALLALELHGVGYDLGLFFFGINSVATGWLFVRAGFPRAIGLGLALAGGVYLVGSTLTVVAPAAAGSFEIAYLIPLFAELAVALWLLVTGQVPLERRDVASAPDVRMVAATA
jgi:hypothetical protein